MSLLKTVRNNPDGTVTEQLFPVHHICVTKVLPGSPASKPPISMPVGTTIELTPGPTIRIPEDWDVAYHINDKGITTEVYRTPKAAVTSSATPSNDALTQKES